MELNLIAEEGDILHVECKGRIADVYYPNDDPFEALLGRDGLKRNVILNLEEVRFLDSSGIGWLLTHHKRLKENGGRLVLYAVPPLILQPLVFTNLTQVLHIADNEVAARTLVGGDAHE